MKKFVVNVENKIFELWKVFFEILENDFESFVKI